MIFYLFHGFSYWEIIPRNSWCPKIWGYPCPFWFHFCIIPHIFHHLAITILQIHFVCRLSIHRHIWLRWNGCMFHIHLLCHSAIIPNRYLHLNGKEFLSRWLYYWSTSQRICYHLPRFGYRYLLSFHFSINLSKLCHCRARLDRAWWFSRPWRWIGWVGCLFGFCRDRANLHYCRQIYGFCKFMALLVALYCIFLRQQLLHLLIIFALHSKHRCREFLYYFILQVLALFWLILVEWILHFIRFCNYNSRSQRHRLSDSSRFVFSRWGWSRVGISLLLRKRQYRLPFLYRSFRINEIMIKKN